MSALVIWGRGPRCLRLLEMRHLHPSSFLLAVFSSGCFAVSSADVAPYEVTVVAPIMGVATGVTASVQVQIHETSHEDWGGWGAGPQVPSLTVDHVTCSPDCVATDAGGSSYDVSATTAGRRNVAIAYSTSDGKHSDQTVTIDFRDPTRIDARRDGHSPSGTVFAMVPGDVQCWTVEVSDASGPLLVDPGQPEVSGSGAVRADNTACDAKAGVFASSPGSGTVTMRYRDLVRTAQMTVIDAADIRQAALRQVVLSPDASLDVDSVEGALAPLGAPLALPSSCNDDVATLVVPQLTTADGTIAFGAANLLRATPADVVDLERSGQVVEVWLRKAGPGTLSGNFGSSASTTLSASFVVPSDGRCVMAGE